jgi:hypothetical protein
MRVPKNGREDMIMGREERRGLKSIRLLKMTSRLKNTLCNRNSNHDQLNGKRRRNLVVSTCVAVTEWHQPPIHQSM